MARIYVSSTYSDLADCRMAVSAALRKLGHEDVAMEHYTADPRRPLDRCLADIDSCDLYIGIFAWWYGGIPPNQHLSFTELEYRHARITKRDCLIFLLAENATWPKERIETDAYDKIVALRRELKEHTGVAEFTGPIDLAAAVTAAVALWQTSRRAPPSVQLAPPLPAHFVERPEVLRDIAAQLLTDGLNEAGILVVSALHGLGGIGKTAAAIAIAHNPLIRSHFTNGTLWATLGQNPDCLSHLTAWIQALGDAEYRPTTAIAATGYLRTLLYTTATLLVVDDVWDLDHATPFLAGGPRCRLLVTTRRADVADGLGARVYSVGEMTPAEAVDLLRKRVETSRPGQALTAGELEHAAALARETGYLPLALALMGALVARGYPWDAARAALHHEQSRRARGASRAQIALEASLQLSLEYLRRMDPNAWENVASLGVLPNDAIINPRMASVLWGMPFAEASGLLNSLADDAILQRSGLDFRIHDLMLDVVRNALTSAVPDGLGLPLAQAHSELVAKYGRTIAPQRWDQLIDDGYIHSHLVWHFEEAGDLESIPALLRLSNESGQNAWYVARDQLGQAAGFIGDLMAGWRLAREDTELSLGRQCRYGLMLASLHSLAQVISPRMLYTLVRRQIWLPAKALAHLHRMVAQTRTAALLELIPLLLEQHAGVDPETTRKRRDLVATLLREAETVIESGAGAMVSAQLLVALGSQHTGQQQAALIARAITLVDGDPTKLKALAGKLPATLRDQIIERAAERCYSISDSIDRIGTLVDVMNEFSSSEKKSKWTEVLQEWTEAIFAAPQNTKKETGRRRKTAPGTRSNTEKLEPEVTPSEAVALSMPPVTGAPHADEEEKVVDRRARVLAFMLDRKIDLPREWFARLVKRLPANDAETMTQRLLRHFSEEETTEQRAANDVAKRFESLMMRPEQADLDELVSLVPLLPGARDQAVRDLMAAYRNSPEQSGELLTRLAPFASEDACRGEIEKLTTEDGRLPVGAECLLANLEPEIERRKRFDRALASLKSMRRYDIEAAMIALIRVAPPDIVHQAIASLQRIEDIEEQIGAIFVVAPYLTKGLSAQILQFLEERAGNKAQIVTLTRMVADLSNAMKGGVLADFVREAAHLSSEWWIVEALTLTMLRFDDLERFFAILKVLKYIVASDLRARLISRLVLRMAHAGYVQDAIDATERVLVRQDRWIILSDLAADLAMAGKMVEAQTVAAAIENSEERGKAAAEIALHMAASGQVREAYALAASIVNELWRSWIQERLDLVRDQNESGSRPRERSTSESCLSVHLDFELLRVIVGELLTQEPKNSALKELASGVGSENLQQTIDSASRFFRAKFSGDKTFLEMIAEQPRRTFLKRLQQVAPLLTIVFTGSDAEEFVCAVREVSMWWP